MTKLPIWKLVLGLGPLAIAGYFFIPGVVGKDLAYSVVGIASTVVMLVGLRLHRPAALRGWHLVVGANACFVIGDLVQNYYDVVLATDAPVPSLADVVYLAGYPLLFVGVHLISRNSRAAGGRDTWTDAAVVCVGALGLTWHFLMGPTLRAAPSDVNPVISRDHDILAKLVTLAYPMMDLAVLCVVVGAVLRGTARLTSDRLLVAAVGVMLISDFGYDLQLLHGGYGPASPVNAGFLLNYVLMAAAATHPSIALARTAPEQQDPQRWRWLPLVAGAAFVSPLIVLIDSLIGLPVDLPMLSATSVVVLVLIGLRVTWLFGRIHRQNEMLSDRGQSLRSALAAQRVLEDDLRHLALHDVLTGLANRGLLHDRVEQAITGSTPRRPVALCVCDLDNFKGVNDSLGHDAGDELLVVVAKRLTSMVGGLATVARLGGDEFAVLMEDADQPESVTALAERILSVLRQPIRLGEEEITLSVSVGVAVAGTGSTAAQLLSEADAAMYEAKAIGKDRVAVFETAMRSRLVEKMALINYFPGSLRREQFYLDYQPQVDLATGGLEGFECLVRWRHPTLGLVSPLKFIPLAEETRFIIPLGRWILQTACERAVSWPVRTPDPLTISVNISGWQLQDPGFVDTVKEILDSTGLAARRLVVEVTETVLLTNPTGTAQVLSDLKSLGIRVAIDDFGTGYSSLSHLRQLPVDIIKIDKSFIDPLTDPEREGEAFVTTIIRLAADLDLLTTAEGIEHRSQRDALLRLGCQSGQGYLMSAPLGAAATDRYIAAHASPAPTASPPALPVGAPGGAPDVERVEVASLGRPTP